MPESKNLINEADVGSGERTPGQKETDKMIEQLPDKDPINEASRRSDQPMKPEHTDSQSGNPP